MNPIAISILSGILIFLTKDIIRYLFKLKRHRLWLKQHFKSLKMNLANHNMDEIIFNFQSHQGYDLLVVAAELNFLNQLYSYPFYFNIKEIEFITKISSTLKEINYSCKIYNEFILNSNSEWIQFNEQNILKILNSIKNKQANIIKNLGLFILEFDENDLFPIQTSWNKYKYLIKE